MPQNSRPAPGSNRWLSEAKRIGTRPARHGTRPPRTNRVISAVSSRVLRAARRAVARGEVVGVFAMLSARPARAGLFQAA